MHTSFLTQVHNHRGRSLVGRIKMSKPLVVCSGHLQRGARGAHPRADADDGAEALRGHRRPLHGRPRRVRHPQMELQGKEGSDMFRECKECFIYPVDFTDQENQTKVLEQMRHHVKSTVKPIRRQTWAEMRTITTRKENIFFLFYHLPFPM